MVNAAGLTLTLSPGTSRPFLLRALTESITRHQGPGSSLTPSKSPAGGLCQAVPVVLRPGSGLKRVREGLQTKDLARVTM